jgi:biotin carboxyl carrier protein
MNVDVTVNGRPWRVALEPTDHPARFQVSVKGQRRLFDASWIDDETLSLIGADAAARRVREIGVRAGDDGQLDVVVAGRRFRVTATAEGAPGSGRRAESASIAGEVRQTVIAPMPGRIVRVLVAVGDRVSANQPVVVIEAMKMENELRSPRDGAVRLVNVQPGDAVEAQAVLVVIE